MKIRHQATLGLGLAFFAAGNVSSQASDVPFKRSALAGVIRDTMSRPIPGATVLVDSIGLSAVSDDSGRFHLAGIPSGANGFTIMRIGYKAVSFTTILAPDTTLVIAIQLRSAQLLPDIVVAADRISPRLARTGFYERRRTGLGSFLTPERIDSLSSVGSPAQLLRDVRGIELVCRYTSCEVHTRRAPDCLLLFVDGAQIPGQLDDVLTTGAVSAIEVYERPSLVPVEFQGRLPSKKGILTARAGCGALVVWTKSRAPRTP